MVLNDYLVFVWVQVQALHPNKSNNENTILYLLIAQLDVA